jgi:hypothetical protein
MFNLSHKITLSPHPAGFARRGRLPRLFLLITEKLPDHHSHHIPVPDGYLIPHFRFLVQGSG